MNRPPVPLIVVARLDGPSFAAAVTRHAEWATPSEQARAAGFVDPGDRFRHLAAHWLARRAVGRYVGVPAHRVRLCHDEAGRPLAVVGGADGSSTPRTCVSLSHSGDWAAVAVVEAARVGIDVEVNSLRSPSALHAVSRRFHPEEQAALAGLGTPRRTRDILRLWTLKEAYAKALGTGLSPFPGARDRLGLDGCAFRLDTPHPELTSLSPPAVPAERWHFWTLPLGPRLTGALAVGRADLSPARTGPSAGAVRRRGKGGEPCRPERTLDRRAHAALRWAP
ncbi:4'-phosphopantetheinyl transferase superfamily protein [Streptomyces sp. NPDC006393]|uniref:4'-phosphopantetheinyl transferase family protein n=1 Tax=Streptomyces sp. NPDC006393 TaxID=3156763 RepID=UPI0033FC3008